MAVPLLPDMRYGGKNGVQRLVGSMWMDLSASAAAKYLDSTPQHQPYVPPVQGTVVNNNPADTAATARAARQREMDAVIYSDIPEIAALQRRWWEIYVATGAGRGVNDQTAEQKRLNEQAEQVRKGYNPMYPGGSKDGSKETQYILGGGTDTPVLNALEGFASGSMILIGVVALLLFRR